MPVKTENKRKCCRLKYLTRMGKVCHGLQNLSHWDGNRKMMHDISKEKKKSVMNLLCLESLGEQQCRNKLIPACLLLSQLGATRGKEPYNIPDIRYWKNFYCPFSHESWSKGNSAMWLLFESFGKLQRKSNAQILCQTKEIRIPAGLGGGAGSGGGMEAFI